MSDRCKPFFQSIKQSASLEWGEEQSKAFKASKNYLSTTQVLYALEDEEDLFLYLSVSEVAVSAILVWEEERKQRPVFYTRKMLLDAETRYRDLEKMVLSWWPRRKNSCITSNPIRLQ